VHLGIDAPIFDVTCMMIVPPIVNVDPGKINSLCVQKVWTL